MTTDANLRPLSRRSSFKLTAPGWNAPTRRALEQIIRRGAGKGLSVVFDFDNTIVRGDIGEAVLAQLECSRRLSAARVPLALAPPFEGAGGRRVTLRNSGGIAGYYEKLLAPTAHGAADPAPLATGYAWAVQAMSGLRLSDVVEATREVMTLSRGDRTDFIQAMPGGKSFPVPRFHPEMVELIAALLEHGFDTWIVSASNVWSVRWTVLHVLNPLLASAGAPCGLAADHVIGVATLLADKRGRLFKDTVLAREDAQYAALSGPKLGVLRLTAQFQFPLPAYSGKVACILDAMGRRPHLCVGDGQGDLSMLAFSEHRLWIARLRTEARAAVDARTTTGRPPPGWLIQACAPPPEAAFTHQTEGLPPEALPPALELCGRGGFLAPRP